LGILPLSLASSTLFRMFFKMFLSIVTFGALHGFVLLPVILPWLTLESTDESTGDGVDTYDQHQTPRSVTKAKSVSVASMPVTNK